MLSFAERVNEHLLYQMSRRRAADRNPAPALCEQRALRVSQATARGYADFDRRGRIF